MQHYNCYSKMVDLCKNANIVSSLSQEVWTVPMFQRAFALYHDQVRSILCTETSKVYSELNFTCYFSFVTIREHT